MSHTSPISYWRIISRLFKEGLFASFLLLLGTVLGLIAIYHYHTPSIAHIREYPFHLPTILYDRSGTIELYRLYDEENRIIVDHDAISDYVRFATIASEDQEFYSHRGINPLSIVRAFWANMRSGEIRQGGSTITQQLARALFLTNEQTLTRKIHEALLAIRIDSTLSKEEILDLYLNTVPYGSNTYGIESAADMFFQKHARDLSLDESALLAALPNAPTYYSPYRHHEAQLRERQKSILEKMYYAGFISGDEFDVAVSIDTFARITPRQEVIIAPHFVFAVIDELKTKYSEAELRTQGLRVITTLDLDLQKMAEKAVRDGAKKNMAYGADNAALVALDAKTGDVIAMVGSKDYYDASIDGNVNVTLQKRQPGSAFKPFAYATAFTQGFQPETPILDTRINFGSDGSGQDYIPENYDGTFHGLLTMRQALAMSLNVPAVQTLALSGIDETITLATAMGITTLTERNRYGLSLALGGAEVRPIDMANAFSVFGQEGYAHETSTIHSITDRSNTKISWRSQADKKQVLDTDVARKMNSILSDNSARAPIFGSTSPLAFPEGITVAGKTGTTQNFRDAWTVGYTPSIAVAVWVGNNDNRPMRAGADGIFVAAPIWRDFMNSALKRFPETGFTAYKPEKEPDRHTWLPNQRKTIYIDKKTGREVSEKKAKKMKRDRLETYTVDERVQSDTSLDHTVPMTINDIKQLYRKKE